MPKSFLIKKKKPESELKTTSAESQLSTPDVNGKVGSFISPLPSNERSFSLVAPSNSYNYTASTQLLIKKEAEDDEGYNIKSKTFSQPEVHGILGLNVRSQGQVHAAEFLDSTRSVSVIRASRVVATSRNYEDAVKIEIPCEEEALLKLRPLHASTVDPKTECSASPCHDSSADNACFLSNGVIPHTLNGYTSPSAAFAISTEDQKPVSCYADDSDDFQLTEFIQFEESCVLGSPCKSPRSPSISETSSSPSPNGHVDVSMETTGEGIPAQGLDHVEGKKYRYPCDVCGKSFSRSNTLTTHKRIHTGDKPFKCEQCGRAFRQPGNLTRHRLTHTTVKPYVCPQCNKAFNRASNLHTHMRTHTNYKPFICDFCGKGFHQKIDMKIHRYTHTGEKPHKCQKCGRGFKQLTHLTYHMRTHSDVRMYECEYCGKGFNQKGNLQAHIYGHTGQRPYKCDFCGKGFTLASTLNTHKRTHASKKPFQCQLCDKAFYQKNALKTHYIASHPFANGVSLL